jgi:hypothetical protein
VARVEVISANNDCQGEGRLDEEVEGEEEYA